MSPIWKICPKGIPIRCGKVLINPNFIPDAVSIALFGPGVINIVHGYGNKVGDALSKHPNVPIISFTGGTVDRSVWGLISKENFIIRSLSFLKKLSN